MGIDIHAINALRLMSRSDPLGKVATMGRQGLHVPEPQLKKMGYSGGFDEFCEDFLVTHFNAIEVESFDYSDFEGATHIVDLNNPIGFDAIYDTVIDAGTLEHVFDVVQALKNVSRICKVGGRILHILPVNNLVNHGFWQFSPELFFSLYSAHNGYSDTQAFLVYPSDPDSWYEITPPTNGRWDYFASSLAIYAVVMTRKSTQMNDWDVQQSQYISDWQCNAQAAPEENPIKSTLKSSPLFKPMRLAYRRLRDPDRTLKNSSDLSKVRIADREEL